MAWKKQLEKYRDPAEPLIEQRIGNIEEGLEENVNTGTGTAGMKLLASVTVFFNEKTKAATFVMTPDGNLVELTGASATFGEAAKTAPLLIPINIAEYEVNGKAPKLVVQVLMSTGSTAPAANFTYAVKLVKEEAAAAEKTMKLEVGATITGVETKFTTPAAEKLITQTSTAAALPAAKFFTPVVVVSAETAAKSFATATFALFVTLG